MANKCLEFSRAISCLNVELKTNVSEISSLSIVRAGVGDDCVSLIFITPSARYLVLSVYYVVGG
jgi:hypothetical protein